MTDTHPTSEEACPVCQGTQFETGPVPFALKVAGKIYTGDILANTCVGCSETKFDLKAREQFEIAVMQSLITMPAKPRAARFLRETLQITPADLARYCGVEPAEVRAWEKRGSEVPAEVWQHLSALVPPKPDTSVTEP